MASTIPQNPDYPQLTFPVPVPFPSSTTPTEQIFLAYQVPYSALSDTNSHSYITDPTTMFILPVMDQYIDGRALSMMKVWCGSTLDQIATVQAQENVVGDQSYPDSALGPSTSLTVPALSGTTPGVAIGNFPWNQFALEYASVTIKCATAPASGNISVVLLLYHGPT